MLLCHSSWGQVGERRSELRLGVTSGVSLNSVDFDPTIKQQKLVGYTGGISLKYTCEKYFNTICAIEAEINYARMGWREDVLSSTGAKLPDTYSREMNYIQLPLLANLGWGREERGFMFYVVAGPQVGYCFSDTEKRSSTWTLLPDGTPDRPNGMHAQYGMKIDHRLDYGITAGAGLELNTRHAGHFNISARYYYGLGDIFSNSKRDVFSRSANGAFVVKLGYYFTVSKQPQP